MRKLFLALAIAALAAVPVTAWAATKTVKVGDNYFVRARGVPTVSVSKGTTVKWVNRGRAPHNVVVTRGPQKFKSKVLSAGKSYSRKVRRRGTYTIVCTIHGAADQSMKLRVR